jgi:hypothetical protein
MYYTGDNIFPVNVADISGTAVTNISGGWSVLGQIGNSLITSLVSSSESSAGNGWYLHTVNLPYGSGFISIKNSDPSLYFSGDYVIDSVSVYSVDDVYSSLSRVTGQITTTNIGTYEAIDAGLVKAGSSSIVAYQVPSAVTTVDISAFTDLSMQLRSDVALISGGTGTGLLGSALLNITAPDTVVITVPGSITSGALVISTGRSEAYMFGDLVGTVAGNRMVLAEFTYIVRRDFNR